MSFDMLCDDPLDCAFQPSLTKTLPTFNSQTRQSLATKPNPLAQEATLSNFCQL